MVRFSEKETCKLVELYRHYECLWNLKDPNYRNRQVNQAACAAIAREMDHEEFTAADVKLKLKALRGTYNQELIKIRRSVESGDGTYRPNIKWFGLMEAFIKKLKNQNLIKDDLSAENGDHIPEGIFPDDSQWEQQSGNSSEIASVNVSSMPSMSNESEIEQSIRSISAAEIITVTPEFQNVQSAANSEVHIANTESQSVQSVPQVVTVSPEILTVKAVSNPEVISATSETTTTKSISAPEVNTVTSGIQQSLRSVSNPEVTVVSSGIQNVKTVSQPKYFTLIPEIQTSKPTSNPKYFMLTPEIQTTKPVSGPQLITLAPEIPQRGKQTSANETIGSRKRRHEEVSSTNSNSDIRQMSNTRSVTDDFSDRNEDEMDAFGHFVALNLRKMSMQSALSAQTEILSILTRYRLNDSSKQMVPYILTNGTSTVQNPVAIQKVFLKS
ncbi:uncharacterized protein LOC129971234 isoform X1 [Argiope bruennichi]|uniref:uncharacterized protein LOC129971234 isoform X1 n=2 Tax=Argiope bruennichi TaxID=94029 RepID=UPI00249502C4|nr:uncharacterized protein LOC129971234 isoform X1 [Argiope bruennichi]